MLPRPFEVSGGGVLPKLSTSESLANRYKAAEFMADEYSVSLSLECVTDLLSVLLLLPPSFWMLGWIRRRAGGRSAEGLAEVHDTIRWVNMRV